MKSLEAGHHVEPLARAIRQRRYAVAEAFAVAADSTLKWHSALAAFGGTREEFVGDQFSAFPDYLAEYFESGDETFKSLFVGEKVKCLYDPALDEAGALKQAALVADIELERFDEVLRPHLSGRDWDTLLAFLSDTRKLLSTPAERTQRVLFVGDCLFLDIVPFVVGPLRALNVRLVPDYATSKNPVELRQQLRDFGARKFDAVFYSPFTYEFAPAYSQLANWRKALIGDAAIESVVQETWLETQPTLALLADLFDCPIHVHNSSGILREESDAKRRAKLVASRAVRKTAFTRINRLLAAEVAQINQCSFAHVFVYDELTRVAGREFEAGGFFYKALLQHPAMMGRMLADDYTDLLFVNAWLNKKKVVVADLDNTLWDGVIGEGHGVQHLHDRQAVLKRLKEKGVVLAINSKNDAANVKWDGATLTAEDFVCAAISWQPKVQGMRRIQDMLNLKMKDYVFVDDRQDERELMANTYPEVCCMDATDPATWRRLALWQALLEDDSEMDRTLMYQQRELRKAVVRDEVASEAERAAMFSSLGLTLLISRPSASELKRVAELINRTNQFNLEGFRTTARDAAAWHNSPDHILIVGDTADRFGPMGVTCVAAAVVEGVDMRIIAFVLSCRVFGYGIETSVMNQLKLIAGRRGLRSVSGHYVETPHNSPCKDFLASNGFEELGDRSVFSIGSKPVVPVPWIELRVASDVR
jgi:FkbH-like protein